MWDLSWSLIRLWSFGLSPLGTLSLEDERLCGENPKYPIKSAIPVAPAETWDVWVSSENSTWNRDEIIQAESISNCWPTESQAKCYFQPLSFMVVSSTARGNQTSERWIVSPPLFLPFNQPSNHFTVFSLRPLQKKAFNLL